MKIPILITSLINRLEQAEFTSNCYKSLTSGEHLLAISIDASNEFISLTHKWNNFLDQYRDREYQYLIIIANDTLAKKESIDYMVRFMQENLDIGIGESKLNRNFEDFLNTNLEYSNNVIPLNDTSNFIIRKGVIEKIGRFNENRFPFAQNERDYIYRCKLGGVRVEQIAMQLFYHPPISLTLENRGDFKQDCERYREIWGGDWQSEQFKYPFNNPDLDFTYSE